MDPEIQNAQVRLAQTASLVALRDLLLEELSHGDPAERLRLIQRYEAIFSAQLQTALEQLETSNPALAAQLDYRDYLPPI